MDTTSPSRSSDAYPAPNLNEEAYRLCSLADEDWEKAVARANITSLDTAIYLLFYVTATWVPIPQRLALLPGALLTRFGCTSKCEDVLLACTAFAGGNADPQQVQDSIKEEVLDNDDYEVDDNPVDIVNLACSIIMEFYRSVNGDRLASAISLYHQALSTQQLGPEEYRITRQLTNARLLLFRLTGDVKYVHMVILSLHQLHTVHPESVSCLCAALLVSDSPAENKEALQLFWDAYECHEETLEFAKTGKAALDDFSASGDDNCLRTAIALLETAACFKLVWDAPQHAAIKDTLGIALKEQFQISDDAGDLDRAILLHREALDVLQAWRSDHAAAFSQTNLGNALYTRFMAYGKSGDLDSAIGLFRKAMESLSADHNSHDQVSNNLACAHHERFQIKHDPQALHSEAA